MRHIQIPCDAIKAGKNVLLEGQLGSLKDPDHGIYRWLHLLPHWQLTARSAQASRRTRSRTSQQSLRLTPAQSAQVRSVSEIFGEEADELRRRGGDGGEFGATTGRPRRMDGSMQSHQDMAYRSRDPQRLPSRFSTF